MSRTKTENEDFLIKIMGFAKEVLSQYDEDDLNSLITAFESSIQIVEMDLSGGHRREILRNLSNYNATEGDHTDDEMWFSKYEQENGKVS